MHHHTQFNPLIHRTRLRLRMEEGTSPALFTFPLVGSGALLGEMSS